MKANIHKDQKIIELIRSGKHSRAIEALYKHYPKIRSLIHKKGGNEEDARDIFQEGLLILCKKAEHPDFVLTSSAGTFLYSVCRFLWKDELQKQNRALSMPDAGNLLPETEDLVSEKRAKEMEFRHLDQVLAQIGEKCLKLLKMYYFERISMKEIAQSFGFSSDNSAKTQKYKCLERARKIAGESKLNLITE